jgi:hypothetical protein
MPEGLTKPKHEVKAMEDVHCGKRQGRRSMSLVPLEADRDAFR